ncbi:hypothetical protein Pmani_029397 [Petrolisthes manimaculis]|uniref:G-protein coupled receptors family 1 profile domain-containing protein n=1 Tax=Petrolisthes manimaculis TaxID=1843537 RepID=A0AAE1NXN6_9EUCA|nr:hypothetical protein Pmani_029397 [Petrolisthes manimaculis]
MAVDCSERDKLDLSLHLLRASVVNWYLVVVAGTIVNLVTVWCVVRCPKTKPPVQLLLLTVFLSTLAVCLITGPLRAEILRAELACESHRITFHFYVVVMVVYSILAQVERISITALAVVRAVAVWSPQRHHIGMKEAVAIVFGVVVYCTLTGVCVLGFRLVGWVTEERMVRAFTIVYFLLNTTIPILVTASSYFTILLAVLRNKRRLERHGDAGGGAAGGGGGVMTQATKALLAISVSNLAFGLPHGIFHLIKGTSHTAFLLVHMFFYHHFIVDPLVFLWFNESHRNKVKAGIERITQASTAPMKGDLEKGSPDDLIEIAPPEMLKRVRDNGV